MCLPLKFEFNSVFSRSDKMHFNFSLTSFSEKMAKKKPLKYLNYKKKVYVLEKFAVFYQD